MSGECHDKYVYQLEQMLEVAKDLLAYVDRSKTFPIRGCDAATSLKMENFLENYPAFKQYWEDGSGEWEEIAQYLGVDAFSITPPAEKGSDDE